MNQAEHFMANSPRELQETAKHLPELSAASESTARRDFEFEDGSALVVTSVQGDESQLRVVHPPKAEEAVGEA